MYINSSIKTILVLLWILSAVGLIFSCQEVTPLPPPNPIIGKWILYNWQTYHVPSWYVAKTNMPYTITPTDTIFAGPPPSQFDVTQLNFNADGTFTESYLLNGGFSELALSKIDTGKWVLADSVVNLSISNSHPHKLTYRINSGELVTDVFPKSVVQQLLDGSVNTINYSIRIKYKKGG